MAELTGRLPDPYPLRRAGSVSGAVEPPGSKSISHRALNLALIGRRPLVVENILEADDTAAFLDSLERMGWGIDRLAERELRLEPPPAGRSASESVRLDCQSAGTLLRFLVAACAVTPGVFLVDGSPRLRERPIGPLVDALRRLGARIDDLGATGYAPVRIHGGSLAGGRVEVDAAQSSQYVSALLMSALAAAGETRIVSPRLVSGPYVETTLQVMRDFGAVVEATMSGGSGEFVVKPHRPKAPNGRYRVVGDDSAAAYPAAAAALCGGAVSIRGLASTSTQGDRAFLQLLERMGAAVRWSGGELRVRGTGALGALDADLAEMPDQVPTLAAVAAFADGVTSIRNVAHLRIKESDRLAAVASELGRAGVVVDEWPDGLRVVGNPSLVAPPGSPRVVAETYDDHRIAMSMALVGLRRGGLSIRHPEVVSKSYPGFWRDLEGIRIDSRV